MQYAVHGSLPRKHIFSICSSYSGTSAVRHFVTRIEPRCRQCNSALGTGTRSPAEGRHWARERPPEGRHGLHWGTGVPAEGRHWPALGPAEGRHWPALGAHRSAVLPAEGRRCLGRRPGTAARAVCAWRSEQCAMYGARLSSMRTPYILLYIRLYCILRYIYEY